MTAEKIDAAKFGLVGFTISREDAPWDDPDWYLAGCNNLWAQPGMEDLWPKAQGWYDLHDLGTITGTGLSDPTQKANAERHLEWLRQGNLPTWVMPRVKQDDWPSAIDFPREILLDWAELNGFAGAKYFTNSVSWMIAHMILICEQNGFDKGRGGEIGLWGIDMATSSEYAAQRPSCEYWLGVAEGRGIKVFVSERADLLKCGFLYGSEDGSDMTRKMFARRVELAGMAAEAATHAEQVRHELEVTVARQNHIAGALENQDYWNNVWLQPEGTRKGEDDPSVKAAEPHDIEVTSG